MSNFSPKWQKVGFAAPNRRTPHIKGKNAHKINLYPNAADFQLKKKERETREGRTRSIAGR
jgi:hypothetical protein